ncbi:hypothetical protein OG871_40500 (plasmid) [Kitasatospora sp. NBC_00374]|uniref:hypothetical protein n=1 Tax=Kitasatospora sp. NBC_00374 TaxID=2975964 RepID=UPI002F90A7A3
MGVLRLSTGRIVGYRLSGRDYPVTMANAQRARNVAHCVERFGRDSNFTAYELKRFGDETGMEPYGRSTWWVVRGINRYLRGEANAVEMAITVTEAEAPVPTVKRPAARAYDALTEAKKNYEPTRRIAEAADLAVTRGGGRALEGASKTLGVERAAELMAALEEHARQAREAAGATRALFIKACDAADEAHRAAERLDVIKEGWAAERSLGLVEQVTRSAAAAFEQLHKAEGIQHQLRHEADRWGSRVR